MLAQRTPLHDVRDAEAFVRACIGKAKLRPSSQDELEELVAEGLVILIALARGFKPHMEGYDQPGSFAGYCSRYLPNKIRAAWHRLHPEHLLETQADGSKRYRYGVAPASLQERMEEDPRVDNESLRLIGNFVQVQADA